ncbi:hypothetical protein AJ88_40700 [Mesorhizobium amorphae CCBAU 01583]|nr:hypothetical protein AJ88_40700 [Mesorhizobium amorphae CCBAU 01583]
MSSGPSRAFSMPLLPNVRPHHSLPAGSMQTPILRHQASRHDEDAGALPGHLPGTMLPLVALDRHIEGAAIWPWRLLYDIGCIPSHE